MEASSSFFILLLVVKRIRNQCNIALCIKRIILLFLHNNTIGLYSASQRRFKQPASTKYYTTTNLGGNA